MAEGDDQSKFISGLRELAKKHAANNPNLAKLRVLGKALADESRKRIQNGEASPTLGAYLLTNDEVRLICPTAQRERAQSEIMVTLQRLATAGQITGGACSTILQRSLVPHGPTVPFIDIQAELVEGLALRSGIPADMSIVEKGIPGVNGPSLPFYGKKVEPKIFSNTPSV